MSRQAIEDFRKKINESKDLQEKVSEIDTDGLLALAKEKGYEIEKPELETYFVEMGAEKTELTDFELELVSGGTATIMTLRTCPGGADDPFGT